MRYGISWDVVAAIPLILGLLLADHLAQGRKSKKKREEQKREKEEARAAKSGALVRKRKTGFRNMKSSAQRIRERTRRMEEAAAAHGIAIEELHEAMEAYVPPIRPHILNRP